MKRFFIPTIGYNGSVWLSQMLNFHENVSCSNMFYWGNMVEYDSHVDYRKILKVCDKTPTTEGKEWKSLISIEKHKKNNRLHTINNLPCNKYMEDKESEFVGDIHGFRFWLLDLHIKKFSISKNDLLIAGLFRHPIRRFLAAAKRGNALRTISMPSEETKRKNKENTKRILDQYKTRGVNFYKYHEVQQNFLDNEPTYIDDLVSGMAEIGQYVKEIEAVQKDNLPYFRIEEFFKDAEYFVHFFEKLFGNIDVSGEFLDYVESNSDAGRSSGNSPLNNPSNLADILDGEPDWVVEMIKVLSSSNILKESFKTIGYEITV